MGARADDGAVLRVLGAISIFEHGQPARIGGEKPRRLLAMLLLHRDTVVSTGRLIDGLWGEDVPETGPATLQSYVSRLRQRLPPNARLVTEPPGYRLTVSPGTTDVDRFEAYLAAGLAAMDQAPSDALALLDEGLAEWHGDAFAEFADEPWAQPEARRLDELRLHAREARLVAIMALGLDERAVGEAQALTVEHPWREEPWRALVVALHRSGRQGDALRAANEYRARLRDELGLDPSPEFVVLARQLAMDPPSRPIVAGATPVRSTLAEMPRTGVELIGRDDDVAAIGALCRRERLVTLLGPGGIGKTQLARRIAVEVAGAATAIEVVELAPVREDASVVGAVATQLGVQTQQGRSTIESLLDLLATRSLLLVLDNCEHVLDAIAGFTERLVDSCPRVSVLTTSREPLGLPRETVYMVSPLSVSSATAADDERMSSPAEALFLRRAAAANPDQVLDDAAMRDVSDLCRRLDGVPLALELAAARTRAFSPKEIAERLNDRFALLTGSSRVGDERHRSLRTLVDWSYHLLDPAAQQLFRRLSTFAGAFDLDAVERVCADGEISRTSVAPLLASLVDKSMVQAATGAPTTYRLLETLRDYGAALAADEAPELARRHGQWLVEVCEDGSVGLHGPDERMWLDLFDRLFDDLRLAVHNALHDDEVEVALRIVVAAREHAFRHLRYELISWTETALAAADHETQPLAAAALGIVAYGRFVRGEISASVEVGRQSVSLAAQCGTDTLGVAERALGNACFFSGDMGSTTQAVEQLIDGALASGDDARVAHAYYMRSLQETRTGRISIGLAYAHQAAEVALRSENPTAQAQAAYATGIWFAADQPAAARKELARCETLARDAGNRWFELFARTETLWLRGLAGEPLQALAGFADVLSAWHQAGDWANQWLSLRHVFGICTRLGADDLAMIIHGALEGAGAVDAFPFEPEAATELERTVDALRARLGHRAVVLEQQGRAGSTSEVIDFIVDRIRNLTTPGVLDRILVDTTPS